MSHQTTVQLDSKLRLLIRNIVGTQVFFSVGGNEADTLSREIATDEPKAVIRNLLMNQKVGNAVVVRRGEPFTRIRTRLAPDPKVAAGAVAAIRLTALQHFGTAREAVEAELSHRDAEIGGIETVATPVTPIPRTQKTLNVTLDTPKSPELEVRDAEDPVIPKARARRKQSPPPAG